MSSTVKVSCSIESSASLDANYTYSFIIKSNSDEQKKESAEANLTYGQPTNILGSKDIVICEPMTNDLAGPRRFRTIHLK